MSLGGSHAEIWKEKWETATIPKKRACVKTRRSFKVGGGGERKSVPEEVKTWKKIFGGRNLEANRKKKSARKIKLRPNREVTLPNGQSKRPLRAQRKACPLKLEQRALQPKRKELGLAKTSREKGTCPGRQEQTSGTTGKQVPEWR